MLTDFDKAPRMKIHPGESSWVMASKDFLAVCRYPPSWNVEEGELGAFVNEDYSIDKRVFCD